MKTITTIQKQIQLIFKIAIFTLITTNLLNAQNIPDSLSIKLKSGNKTAENLTVTQVFQYPEVLFNNKAYVIIQLAPNTYTEDYQFTEYGIELMGYIPENAYWAALPNYITDADLQFLNVSGIYIPQVEDRLSLGLTNPVVPIDSLGNNGILEVVIETHDNVDKAILETLPYLQIFEDSNYDSDLTTLAEINPADLDVLLTNAYVKYVDLKHEIVPLGNTRTHAVGGAYVQHPDYGGLTGEGVKVRLKDNNAKHLDLRGRVTDLNNTQNGCYQNNSAESDHGNMCAGMIAAMPVLYGSKYQGVAPKSDVYLNICRMDEVDFIDMQVSSVVEGSRHAFGEYTPGSKKLDEQLINLPRFMHAVSAGNMALRGTSIKWNANDKITKLTVEEERNNQANKIYTIYMTDVFQDGTLDLNDLSCNSPQGAGLSNLAAHLQSKIGKAFTIVEKCPSPSNPDIELVIRGFIRANCKAVNMVGETQNGSTVTFEDVHFNGGFETICSSWQTAKNIISVGAMSYSADTIWNQSSRGPVDDGRIKPEIVAIGHQFAGQQSNNSYSSGGGTSFSGPQVAGGLALLAEKYKQIHNEFPMGGLSKAILLNTATDYGNPGPDYKYGYGKMNLKSAIDVIDQNLYSSASIEDGDMVRYRINVPANLHQFKVMLSWLDAPGTTNASKSLINNLDIQVKDPSNNFTYPLILNPSDPYAQAVSINNVKDYINNNEQIVFNNPMPGTYEITIFGTSINESAGIMSPSDGPSNSFDYYNYYSLSNSTKKQDYHISLQMVEKELTIMNPIKDEIVFGAGPSHYIEWDYSGPVSSGFNIEYSFDNGSNWTNLTTITDPEARIFKWAPSYLTNININDARLRITAINTGYSDLSEPFKVYDVIDYWKLKVVEECQDVVKITWDEVQDAVDYVVTQYNGVDGMDDVFTTNATSAFVEVDFTQPDLWFAVQPVFAGNERGVRSRAKKFTPPANSAACDCKFNEYEALKTIYQSTNGSSWLTNTWPDINSFQNFDIYQPFMDMASWTGVTLNAQGCVEELNLNNLQLIGSLPEDIQLLASLKVLNVANNFINGSIPNGVGQLTSLETLNLTNNQLNGSIPSSLSNLTNLEYLYLKYNGLSGSIPAFIGDLNKLVILSIHDNQFTGTIPPNLGNLPLLQNFMLDDNQLTGTIPTSLINLSSLINLRLNGNQLTGSIPAELAYLPNLWSLVLHNNDLSGCYDPALQYLCTSLGNNSRSDYISDGNNNLDADWEIFCNTGNGMCANAQFANCLPSININDSIPLGEHRAGIEISTSGFIIPGDSVLLKAGHVISLMPGFEISSDSELNISIEGCN